MHREIDVAGEGMGSDSSNDTVAVRRAGDDNERCRVWREDCGVFARFQVNGIQ